MGTTYSTQRGTAHRKDRRYNNTLRGTYTMAGSRTQGDKLPVVYSLPGKLLQHTHVLCTGIVVTCIARSSAWPRFFWWASGIPSAVRDTRTVSCNPLLTVCDLRAAELGNAVHPQHLVLVRVGDKGDLHIAPAHTQQSRPHALLSKGLPW